MSDRDTEGGENHKSETYVAGSGRCRIRATCVLTCVGPCGGYIGVEFQAGEEHGYDRLQWPCKDGSHSGGFVLRTGDGDAYLMGYLFERHCEVIGEGVASPPTRRRDARPIRVVNVKGMNKPDQRTNIVYVGRKFAGWPEHELHNPFKPRDGEPVGECLKKYKADLTARLTLEADLAALWDECQQGRRPLGCWCTSAVAGDGSEVVCHAQVLAEMLRQRFCCSIPAAA